MLRHIAKTFSSQAKPQVRRRTRHVREPFDRRTARRNPKGDEMTRFSLDKIASSKVYEETNIYDDKFKAELMEFCHYYQIPYLETNIPKSTKNAAKIYYRIL